MTLPRRLSALVPALVPTLAAVLVVGALGPFASTATSAPEARQVPRGKAGGIVRVEHRDPNALPSRGPSNALVTIEVFYTPGPSSRHQAVKNLERLQGNHPTRIRIVYRVVKGSTARYHYAALHAHAEGRFFEFMEALHASPSRSLDDRALLELGTKVGLDPERLASVISRPPAVYDAVLEANARRRQQKIRGNPTLPNALFNGRLSSMSLSVMSSVDLEREYQTARDAAEELLDHGVPRSGLMEAFDQIVQLPEEIVVYPGPTDEELDDPTRAPSSLARPPLDYTGLPSHGPAEAPITIAVLCSPTSPNCNAPLTTAQRVADLYPEQVRVVWAPYFDVGREDAAELSMLADGALCAERDGGRAIDRDDVWDPADSPGWRWVREVLAQSSGRNRRLATTDQLIDRIALRLRIEGRAFATCRAKLAGASITWIEAARRAGVRSTPATIVNGRIYGPINDSNQLHLLVEAELAPGLLAPPWTRGAARPPVR